MEKNMSLDDIHIPSRYFSEVRKRKTYSIIFQLIKLFVVQKILFGPLDFLLEFPMKAFARVDVGELFVVLAQMMRFTLIN
jgi:hypothetical protein